jgi:hypothetical protein
MSFKAGSLKEFRSSGPMSIITFETGDGDVTLGIPGHQLERLGVQALQAAADFRAALSPGATPVIPVEPLQVALDNAGQFVVTLNVADQVSIDVLLSKSDAEFLRDAVATNLRALSSGS